MRTHVIQMWTDAAEYSGEMIGRRSSESRSIYLKNGQANTAMFADDEPKGKVKPKSSIMDKIDLANRHLNRMEIMSAQLEHDFDNGILTLEEYSRGRRIMDERIDKAFKRVAEQEGWKDEAIEEQEPVKANLWTESRTTASKRDSIFLTLPVDNSFRRAYTWLQKAKNLFKG